jgi:hypothetical protein
MNLIWLTLHYWIAFWILLQMNLWLLSESESLSESLEFTNALPFITAWEPKRDHHFQGFCYYCSSWMCCLGNHVLISKQRFGFLSVYNFQCLYPWKLCFVISWFPGISLSMATCLPIHFLEMAHMSQYVQLERNMGKAREVNSTKDC